MRAFLALVPLLAAACGQDEGGGDKSTARAPDRGAELGAAAKAGKVIEGPLTVERMVAAKAGVRPYDPWDKAWAHLVTTSGEPTSAEGDVFSWTLLVGETCHVLEVRRAEDRVDGVMYGPYEKGTSQHERCAAPGK